MTEESRLQVRPKGEHSSLALSKTRTGLIARGRMDAEVLAAPVETESKESRRSFELQFSFFSFEDDRGREERLKDGEKGDAKRQNILGWPDYFFDYKYGSEKATKEQAETAVAWFRKAADLGLPEAQFNLGLMYDNGTGVAQDYAEAAKWYRHAAEQGVREAQFSLGVMCDKGEGVAQDYAAAVEWYRKAADLGLPEAQFNLGLMYDNGTGVARDHAEAAKWYSEAAGVHHGLYKAQFNLGLKFTYGQGVVQDLVQAYKWMNLAERHAGDEKNVRCTAMRDSIASKLNPAQIVEAQRLVREYVEEWDHPDLQFDFTEAVRWWRKAADVGNADAQTILGDAYFNGQGVEQDWAEAAKWYRKAADSGNAEAQRHMGDAYRSGQGVKRDYTAAVAWYRKAEKQGYSSGQQRLGEMYYDGRGVPQDDAEAVNWYRTAAEQGNADAMRQLSYAYAHGEGVPEDYIQAYMWITLAVMFSNTDCFRPPLYVLNIASHSLACRDRRSLGHISAQDAADVERLALEWEAEWVSRQDAGPRVHFLDIRPDLQEKLNERRRVEIAKHKTFLRLEPEARQWFRDRARAATISRDREERERKKSRP